GIFQRLEPFDARKIFRNDLHDFDVRYVFFQAASSTGDRAPRADASDEVRYLPFRLRNDFGRSRLVMRKPVVLVRVLVAMKVFSGLAIGNPMAFTQRFVISFEGIGLNKLRTMRLNTELALPARIARHDNL